MWGRISANDRSDLVGSPIGTHSDKWTEDVNNPEKTYWINNEEFGTKRHEFDAEYWLEPKPIRSCYVTAGDDSANYPSKKYDGITDLKFKLNELENGIRRSNNYPEQLLYIYGTNQMSDFGDLSKMYWTEFKLEGDADKLTRLKLGHDGTTLDYASDTAQEEGKAKENIRWYNNKLNGITLPALPLLKEANFSNIGLVNETALDFTKSAKLQNFRAAGASNLTSVTFAPGVALNTLYLPSSVNNLKLTQANLLTDLIKDAATAVPRVENGELIATPGLYLEGFFDTGSSINTISLNGGALGYNSFELLAKLYERYNGNGKAYVTMKDVKWCPYTALTEGDSYSASAKYYIDNGHYGFNEYTYVNQKKFNADVLSGLLYRDDGFGGRNGNQFSTKVTQINDNVITMLEELSTNTVNFADADSSSVRPQITGIIYIHNTSPLEESEIATLQTKYPNLTFFFAKVTQAYSAKFILYNEEDFSYTYVKHADGSTSPSVQKISAEDYNTNNNIFFTSPYPVISGSNKTGYLPEKTHYDFQGWCKLNDDGTMDKNNIISESAWSALRIDPAKYDYVYCAVFTIHEYELSFYNTDGSLVGGNIVKVPYGNNVVVPTEVPYKDDSGLELLQTYNFKGYSLTEKGDVTDVTELKVTSDRRFYAQFDKTEDIRKVVHPEWFEASPFTYRETSVLGGSTYPLVEGIALTPKIKLRGKITIPRQWKDETGTHDVIALTNFTTLGDNITHIFMEKQDGDTTPAPLIAINTSCFNSSASQLKYFDFAGTSIRGIMSQAFRLTPLDYDLIDLASCTTLQAVGANGFNQSGNGDTCTVALPGSMVSVGNNGFSNLNIGTNSALIIGSKEYPSVLDLTKSTNSASQLTKFSSQSDLISTVTFYSTLYSGDDFVMSFGDEEVTVYDFFTGTNDYTDFVPTFSFG